MTKTARFQQLRNDLFWDYFDDEQGWIKWIGYNDHYWWNNVAISDEFQVRGSCRLNPDTNEVTMVPVNSKYVYSDNVE